MPVKQIDASFDLLYTRLPHPKYRKRGRIADYEMIKHSVNMHRECFGGCSFCTISAPPRKLVASRSQTSILKEVETIKQMPDFRGTTSDLEGPSGNMYQMKGKEQWICDECVRPSCIWLEVCRNLDTDHTALLDIYQAVRETERVEACLGGKRDSLRFVFARQGGDAGSEGESRTLYRGVGGAPCAGPEQGVAGAHQRPCAAGDAQAELQSVQQVQGEV